MGKFDHLAVCEADAATIRDTPADTAQNLV
jgi:hypothetical protein